MRLWDPLTLNIPGTSVAVGGTKGLNGSNGRRMKQERTVFLEVEATAARGEEEKSTRQKKKGTDHFAMTVGMSPKT
jgi:hypothetical protein